MKFKKCIVMLVPILMFFMISCEGQGGANHDLTTGKGVSTLEVGTEDAITFNDEPVKILCNGSVNVWGDYCASIDMNFITLSELCEKELGFPINFIKYDGQRGVRNQYATYIRSGLAADLIFPTQVYTTDSDGGKKGQYWGDQYIEEGIYMDISPYLAQFCPEAILNFDRYPEIKNMCIKNEKVYALYAGMPEIFYLSILVRNELLEQNNISSINDFDALYEIMQNMYHGRGNIPDNKKIVVDTRDLLFYSIYQAGYYPMFSSYDIVLELNDDKCKLHQIENTDIWDTFYNEFYKFFENSYFYSIENSNLSALANGNLDMYITNKTFSTIKALTRYAEDNQKNLFKNYSIFIFNDQQNVIRSPDTFQLVMVPQTCTQPEKALHLMQWLMTDEDASEILTYGSATGIIRHYQYSEDGNIIPEKDNSLYAFYNLIANTSTKKFLYGLESCNIAETYREMTYDLIYPPLYKRVDSEHKNFEFYEEFQNNSITAKSKLYITGTLQKLISNNDGTIMADDIKKHLSDLNINGKRMEYCTNIIRNIMESSEIIYGE